MEEFDASAPKNLLMSEFYLHVNKTNRSIINCVKTVTAIRIGRQDLVRNYNFQVMVFPENIIDNKMLSVYRSVSNPQLGN